MLKWMTKRCPQTRMCLPLILLVFLVLNLRLSLEKEYQHGNEQEPVTDVLMEFLETESIHTGIVATCRRPIKGAAGQPVQFKYPDLPASPMTLQRQALERCLVPL